MRNLRAVGDHGLVAWDAGDRDPHELAEICHAVLEAAGGYLQAGYQRGERRAGT